MANKLKNGKYQCTYCGKEHSDPVLADLCRDGHDLVYVRLSKTDLDRLQQFLHTANSELITETLWRSIMFRRDNAG